MKAKKSVKSLDEDNRNCSVNLGKLTINQTEMTVDLFNLNEMLKGKQ